MTYTFKYLPNFYLKMQPELCVKILFDKQNNRTCLILNINVGIVYISPNLMPCTN